MFKLKKERIRLEGYCFFLLQRCPWWGKTVQRLRLSVLSFHLPLILLHPKPLYNITFNPFQNKSLFLRVCSANILKTLWEKEILLVTSEFSFSHSIFYPFGELSVIFIEFEAVASKLFQFGRV